jgi:uncharacterized membrane protein YccC
VSNATTSWGGEKMRSFLVALLCAVPTGFLLADYILYHEIKWWLFLIWIVIMSFGIAVTLSEDKK